MGLRPEIIQKRPPKRHILYGLVEHTLHELLKWLLDYPEDVMSILRNIRRACNLRKGDIRSSLRVVI